MSDTPFTPPLPSFDFTEGVRLPTRSDGLGSRFVVLGLLGRGGMGVVQLVRDTLLDRECAYKSILTGDFACDAERDRFFAEARAAARLSHPGVVRVFEVGEHDGRPFMLLEYCPGGSLAARLAGKPLPPREAAALVASLADAVGAAHAENVVHRDLKPANVLFDGTGAPRLADFGLARRLDLTRMSRDGAVVGTPSYMPPEQARGDADVGAAADIYALGAVLYECLTGAPPFRSASPLDILRQVLADEPVPPRVLDPAIPTDLQTIALKCLRKTPADRYGSAGCLADDLRRWSRGEPIVARPAGVIERGAKWLRRNAVVSALAGMVGLSLTAGLAASLWFAGEARERAKEAGDNLAEANAQRKRAEDRADEVLREKLRADRQRDRAERETYAALIGLAHASLGAGGAIEANRRLDATLPHLRGWEYFHLRAAANAPRTFPGLGRDAGDASFSPDGTRVAACGMDVIAAAWDASTGRELFRHGARPGGVPGVGGWLRDGGRSVSWSPDGSRIVASRLDGSVLVLDATTGKQLLGFRTEDSMVIRAAFGHDGSTVVACSMDRAVRVYDAVSGSLMFTVPGSVLHPYDVAVRPDGRLLAVADIKGVVHVLDARTGRRIDSTTLKPAATADRAIYGRLAWGPHGARPAALSPDGSRFVVPQVDGLAVVRDARSRDPVFPLRAHDGQIYSAHYSPDGSKIVTACRDGFVRVFASDRPRDRFDLTRHVSDVVCVAWSPDGSRMVSGGNGGEFRWWEPANGRSSRGNLGGVTLTAAAVSPDGSLVLFGGDDLGRARLLDTRRKKVRVVATHGNEATAVAWSRDGMRYVTAGTDGTARVADARTGRRLSTLVGHSGAIRDASFSPDGRYVLTAGDDGTARVWAGDAEAVVLRGHLGRVNRAGWSPDGSRIVTAGHDKTVRIYSASTGGLLLTLADDGGEVVAASWSSDGSRLLTADGDTLRVRDGESGGVLLALRGGYTISSAAWSPDGTYVVAGQRDGVCRVWAAPRE